MQEMQHPDGTISREFFTDAERTRGDMQRRRKQLGAQGYSVTRVAYIVKQGKYRPHQGTKEIARRAKQIARDALNRAKREATLV